ncbi:MarR family winged helix-turn-helix transcriptional regulator [Glycomyces albidus]|uniref:MarR family transcriptional regulator n=1 Tax=Glycomyces albidus TaxID=2656774 RepID=A0A6L5G553_9ACTN|nr:MarR family winged helix-turn-helix transcriptional regulator [Glycomyces albidus]MQM24755.1 MarR family transcriptional regulator [Glycomyces albidus]
MTKQGTPLTATLTFGLGTLGAVVTDRFAAAIAPHDLKPKQVGVLAILAAGAADSQVQIAKLMGVAPSLIVALVDRLEALGAVTRRRDPDDRRRQVLALTDAGTSLLETCGQLAAAIDAELTADLDATEEAVLRRVVARLSPLPRH